LGLLLAPFLGCGEPAAIPPDKPPQQAAELAAQFDATTVGLIRGQVTWQGEVPVVPPIESPINIGAAIPAGKPTLSWKNPNAPVIDAQSRGVGQAVVFIRNVESHRAKPWDLPPVRIEQRDYGIHVRQGDGDALIGFVQRGANVEMMATQPVFHFLRARGAASFALTFPDPNRPRTRRLDKNGLVELSSAAGYSWMRGYLFVDEHPYYCLTDDKGRFELRNVPAGEYELVCWLPNWREASHDRDPESGVVVRLFFKPPLEKARHVVLSARGVGEVHFQVQTSDFPR